jgi:bifunctional ADP-heptose synthase (sugar kinase/adenylyltransferase)
MAINNINIPTKAKEYSQYFNYSFDYVKDYIEKINSLNILVLGERFIDEYQFGSCVDGIFIESTLESYDGGSLAVRNHLSHFNDHVDVLFGQTITKRSYLDGTYKIFDSYNVGEIREVKPHFYKYDLVIVVDYGHGMLNKSFRDEIKNKAKFLAVNTKRRLHNSVRKYWDRRNNIFICLNEDELRCAVHDRYDRYEDLGKILANEFANTKIIVTTGYNGCMVGSDLVIPSFAPNVVDAVGAGDAFLSLSAPLVLLGAPMEVAGFVGNAAGGITCGYFGNKYSVTKPNLYDLMDNIIKEKK